MEQVKALETRLDKPQSVEKDINDWLSTMGSTIKITHVAISESTSGKQYTNGFVLIFYEKIEEK